MSNQRSEGKNKSHNGHDWEKVERKLDVFSYYYLVCKKCHEVRFPGHQLANIKEYAKENLFFFVQDWVLLLLYSGHDYIAGITHYQKMLFLIFYEFAPEHSIPTENPGFYGYKYGPYSARIDETIDFLTEHGYIETKGRKSSSKELFYITSKGKEKSKSLFSRLSREQQQELMAFRKYWDQKTTEGILKYIYSNPNYKDFIKESVILDDLFPGRKLHRRRG